MRDANGLIKNVKNYFITFICLLSKIKFIKSLLKIKTNLAEYYRFNKFDNITRKVAEDAVRKIIESTYSACLSNKISNATIDLISNASFLRYMQDVDFYYDMPGVVVRLQDVVFY